MPDCKSCRENRQNVEPVPYIVHESAMARQERTIKRLWILLILVISLLVATNGAWIWYESQWEDVVVEQEVDTGEGNAFVAGVGDVNYGKDQAESDAQNP
jgi:hypothetical protein